MTDQERTVWGIHGGKTGDADRLFLKSSRIALGWNKIGDLSALAPNRDAFKAMIVEAYPEKKAGAIPVDAGQLYRFVHEMQIGHLIVYPSKNDKQVHIGEVTGGYIFGPDKEAGYPHQRPVKWLKHIPRTRFSQGALYEIGSAMSFFQVRNFADEFLAALERTPIPTAPTDDATTVARITEDVEDNTRDFILKQLSRKLKGHPLAEFIAHLLETMGYRTRVSPDGPDGGVDIIAHKDELGFEPPIIKVQVKSSESTVGDPVVTALYGKVETNEFGLFVTLGSFSPPARNFARNKSNLRLIDGDELVNLILQHYEDFDAQYKGLLPLKKVYVPEAIEVEGA